MNDFGDRLGGLADEVGKDYGLTAPDNAALLVRRARRGRVLWTATVGSAALASAAAIAVGGSAVATSLSHGPTPAGHSTSESPSDSLSTSADPSETVERTGIDDLAT